MNNVEIYKCEQGSEAWFDLRCGRITASKFKELMAGENTDTYKNLIYQTVAEIISGEIEESYTSPIMERGIEMEDEAVLEYELINECITEKVGFVTNEKYIPELFGVSPDRYIGNNIIEVKCPLAKTHIKYIEKDTLPNEYKWQVQGQLLITEAEWCDFISYYPNIRLFVKRVYPDKEMQTKLIERMEITADRITKLVNKIK